MKTVETKAKESAAPKAPKKPAPSVGSAGMPSEDDYRAQDDMRTLSRAEEIRMDAKRMSAASDCADKEMSKLARIKVQTSKPMKMK